MSEFIPSGYISVADALEHIGREFSSEWTGQERRARTHLIGIDEWLRIKDSAPARGSGAPDGAPLPTRSKANSPHPTGDPSSESYQEEYRAGQRYEAARDRLRVLLESGEREAAILDPFFGKMHRAAKTLWRQSGVDRMIKKGRAPIPGSPNTGSIIIKEFRAAAAPAKPLPRAKISEAIKALQEEMAKESLTRPQQAHFVRERFSDYHVSERQMRQICQSVTVRRGRPKRKSDTKGG
jgi:hypothetical protein